MKKFKYRKVPHKTIAGKEYKWCYICKKWKPISKFRKNKWEWDGFNQECKECYKKWKKEIVKYKNKRKYKAFQKKRKEEILSILGNCCFLCGQKITSSQKFIIHHLDYSLYKKEIEKFGEKLSPSSDINWIRENRNGFCVLHPACHELVHQILNFIFIYKRFRTEKEMITAIRRLLKNSKFSSDWVKILDTFFD